MSQRLALIIEDNDDAAFIFSEALKANGLETECIISGDEALERLAQIIPDIILLDLHLPRVSGATIFETIRHDERLRYVPVIVVSAEPDLVQEQLKGQAEFVLPKPSSYTDIVNFTAQVLERTR